MTDKKVKKTRKPALDRKILGDLSSPDVSEYRKRYMLKLLDKGFELKVALAHVDITEATYFNWRKRDKIFKRRSDELIAENKKKLNEGTVSDLISLLDKIRPYLQRHLTEVEACAESGVNYYSWKETKRKMKASSDPVAKWFLEEVANAKLKIFALAKNTLTNGVKVNPKLAFDFLKSTQPAIYTDGRREITGANGEKLMHAYPMSPGDYQKFLEEIAGKKEKDEEAEKDAE